MKKLSGRRLREEARKKTEIAVNIVDKKIYRILAYNVIGRNMCPNP